jgi:hypothetical protein
MCHDSRLNHNRLHVTTFLDFQEELPLRFCDVNRELLEGLGALELAAIFE